MPDLGKYAAEVLFAYAGTLVMLAVLVAMTWIRSHKIRQQLEAAEARKN